MSILFITYILVLIFLIVNFVKCLKNKAKWRFLFIFIIISILLSLSSFIPLPGSGSLSQEQANEMFGQQLLSYGATILYFIMLVITSITKLIIHLKKI